MGTTSSSLYMTYVADVLIGSTHGFEVKDLGFWSNWPWTIPKAACRVAYMVLMATSMQQIRWDLEAGCVRISPPNDENMLRQAVVKVAQAQIPMTRKWALEKRVGETLLRVHWDMYEAIEMSAQTKIPLLLPSATELHEQLMSDAARVACEDFLVRCTSGGWVDEMTNPGHEPKTLYEQDCYPERAHILKQLIPHLHEELAKAACIRQAREVATSVLLLARKRFDAAEERNDPDALVASLVLKHVQSVQVNGADPSASSTYVIPQKKRKGVPVPEVAPADGIAVDALTNLLAASLRPAYLAREEAYIGGPGAARRLAENIVNSVYGQLRPDEDYKVRMYQAEMAHRMLTLGSILTGQPPPPPFVPEPAPSGAAAPAGFVADMSVVTDANDYKGDPEFAKFEREPGLLERMIGIDGKDITKLLALRAFIFDLAKKILECYVKQKKKDGDSRGEEDDDDGDMTSEGDDVKEKVGGGPEGKQSTDSKDPTTESSSKDDKPNPGDGQDCFKCIWDLLDGTHKDMDSKQWSDAVVACFEKLPNVIEKFDEILTIVPKVVKSPMVPKHISEHILEVMESRGKSWKDGWKTFTASIIEQDVESNPKLYELLKERGMEVLEHLLNLAVELLGKLNNLFGIYSFAKGWKKIISESKHYQKLAKVLGDDIMKEINAVLEDNEGESTPSSQPADAKGATQQQPSNAQNPTNNTQSK